MSTQMIQNGNIITGTNASTTYAESENKNSITIYKYIFNTIGLQQYYSGNTVVANVLLSVVLVILLLILAWIFYAVFFSSNEIKISGGYGMTGGSRHYFNVLKTPQIVNDMFN